MATTKSEAVPEEMVKAAEAQLEEVNATKDQPDEVKSLSTPRVKKGGRSAVLIDSDEPFPEVDFDLYGPTGYGTSMEGLPRTGSTNTQQFYIDASKVKHLPLMKPNQNLPKKRLYVVKALHKDGRLVQLGAELQIMNNAGGDPGDMIGLRRYQRKGLLILLDFETGIPFYCAAWGCFAKAQSDGAFVGFCHERHARHTLPNAYKNAGQIVAGLMEQGVTTSRTWSA